MIKTYLFFFWQNIGKLHSQLILSSFIKFNHQRYSAKHCNPSLTSYLAVSQHDARIEILNRVVMWEPTQRYWTGIEVNPSPEWSPASSGPENRKKGSWTSTERVVTWLRGLAIVSGFFSALSPSGFSYRIIFIVIPRLFNRYWSRSVGFHPI